MATRAAVGIMQELAMRDIEQLLGIVLPSQGRDPDLIHAQQLVAIADALREREAVAESTPAYSVGLDLASGESVTAIFEPPKTEDDTNLLPAVKPKRTPNPKQRA